MAKDTYFFPHDYNARNDPKILQLLSVYKFEGYGWYWALIEMMREADGNKLPLVGKYQLNGIAMALLSDGDTIAKFIEDCIKEFQLFSSDNEFFWSESLQRRVKEFQEKKEKFSFAGKLGAKSRWENNNAIASPLQRNNNDTKNDGNIIKESKVKENIYISHTDIINLYNSLCCSLPKIEKITKSRLLKLNARLKELPDINKWELLFKRIEASDFLTGRQERTNGHQNWLCNFDWIIQNDTNIVKVFEGKYDNKLVVKPEIKTRTIRDIKDVISREN